MTNEELEDWMDNFYDNHETNPSQSPADYCFRYDYDHNLKFGMFSITPKEYYDKTGYFYDGEDCVPDSILPDGFVDGGTSQYEYEWDDQDGEKELLKAGFVRL